ncbi:hypothetical protein QYE76_028730 [Lolium multiflorum]|uniref:Uncharacterized protein n=1 Tax=Lolium multiflorum TaxID=4521 RepID=A0AAD8VEV3_LOLMU|nr:hypothetical protein QYE76_028730 [Lolium multiflorum]
MMSRCLKTTYSMLGLNCRALPPPPSQPQPQDDAENSSDEDADPRFAAWHEAYVADAEAEAVEEAVEEAAQSGEPPDTRTARDRWEPQVEGVMRTAVSFPLRNQGLSNR